MSEGELPDGWAESPLELCVDVLDHMRVPVNSSDRARRPGSVPYFGATGQVGWIDDFLFDEELLLLGEDGAPFLDKTKDVAYIVTGKAWVNNHAHVMRARPELTSALFLKHFLNAFDFAGSVNGTTRLKLTQGAMKAIAVKLPPLAEQRRIVVKVEGLVARVNAARERLALMPALLKQFRQAVLAAACDGRLTADWRPAAPEGNAADEAGSEGLSDVEIPESWAWRVAASLCDPGRALTYGVIKLGSPTPGGVPTLRSSDVRHLFIDTRDVKRISKKIADQYMRTLLQGGEVLVTVRGTLGGVGVATREMSGWNVSREVAVLPVLAALCEPSYLAIAIASRPCQDWLLERAKGVAYTGINIQDLRMLPIPLPPKAEQAEVVARVEALFNVADAIEGKVISGASTAEKLPQAILAKAFRGQLVPTEAELARRISRAG